MLTEGGNLLTGIIEPVLWLASSTFRARTRERWSRAPAGERIAQVGFWLTAWGLVLVLGATAFAVWLRP